MIGTVGLDGDVAAPPLLIEDFSFAEEFPQSPYAQIARREMESDGAASEAAR